MNNEDMPLPELWIITQTFTDDPKRTSVLAIGNTPKEVIQEALDSKRYTWETLLRGQLNLSPFADLPQNQIERINRELKVLERGLRSVVDIKTGLLSFRDEKIVYNTDVFLRRNDGKYQRAF